MKRFGFIKSRRRFWSSCEPSLNPEQCKHRRTKGPEDQSLRFLSVGGSRWLQQTLTSRVTAARKFTSLRQSVKGGNPTLITVSRTELRSTELFDWSTWHRASHFPLEDSCRLFDKRFVPCRTNTICHKAIRELRVETFCKKRC